MPSEEKPETDNKEEGEKPVTKHNFELLSGNELGTERKTVESIL